MTIFQRMRDTFLLIVTFVPAVVVGCAVGAIGGGFLAAMSWGGFLADAWGDKNEYV